MCNLSTPRKIKPFVNEFSLREVIFRELCLTVFESWGIVMDKVNYPFFCGLNFSGFHMDNFSSTFINVPQYYSFLFLSCEALIICWVIENFSIN